MTHSDAVRLALLALSDAGCLCWRNETGMFQDARGGKHRIGLPGSADIIGTTGTGRAIGVEIKVGRDRLRPDQAAWRDAWQSRGGLYLEVHPDRDGWKDELAALVRG